MALEVDGSVVIQDTCYLGYAIATFHSLPRPVAVALGWKKGMFTRRSMLTGKVRVYKAVWKTLV